MTLCKRLVARLDIKGNKLIKGLRFEGLRVIGNPYEFAIKYAKSGVDELLYIDAVASLYGRNSLSEVLRQTSKEIFVPITAGGGIRSVEDASKLLAAGADKIAINTAAILKPKLITELSKTFGSQCVVASIQASRKNKSQKWEALTDGGRERSNIDVIKWCIKLQELGAGEILLTSVDKDGTCDGPDNDLISTLSNHISIPLVVGGGFSSKSEIKYSFQNESVSAVSIGAALHKNKLNILDIKNDLTLNKIPIRPVKSDKENIFKSKPLNNVEIGIIDYGMGNLQSLTNALNFLGCKTIVSFKSDDLSNCDILALPGVGAFPKGMNEIRERGLCNFIRERVRKGKPILGICLGMQLLFEYSEEFYKTNGLGLIDGYVCCMPTKDTNKQPLVLPHMGWNLLTPNFENFEKFHNSNQYFVHSYSAMQVKDSSISYTSNYGGHKIIAGVKEGNVAGLQFHPERSGDDGLLILCDVIKKLLF